MVVDARPLSHWSANVRRNLRYATLDGGMLKAYMKRYPDAMTFVAFANTQVMGWALAFCHNGEVNLNIFVNHRYRGRKISRLLVDKALEQYPVIRLAIHNTATKRIFQQMERDLPGKVVTYNWWKVHDYYQKVVKC